MKCTKCGKEIPEGEKKICDECQNKLLNEISQEDNTKNVEKEKSKKENTNKKTDNKKSKEKKDTNEKEKKSKKNIVKYVIIIVVILLILIALFFRKDVKSVITNLTDDGIGNSIANIRNYGYTAQKGNWIYYVAPNEDGDQIAIYKSKLDGSDRTLLVENDWDVLGLNVVGDYVYFIGIDDEEVSASTTLSIEAEELDTVNNVIYRMKLDGSELEPINENAFHNNCYEIYVIKDKIYYIGVDTNIWSMNLDGTEKTQLNNDETGYLGITEDYIILNIEKAQDEDSSESTDETALSTTKSYETYIMNLDGSNKHSLTGERLYSINVVDDYVYYVNTSKEIYKVKVDGTDNTKVSDSRDIYNMNISNGYIFYMSYINDSDESTDDSNEKIGIYRMNMDGTDDKLIYTLDSYSTFLNTVDGNVVFMDSNTNSGTINMINSDGENKILLYELSYATDDLDIEDEETVTEDDTTAEDSETTDITEDADTTENTEENQ